MSLLGIVRMGNCVMEPLRPCTRPARSYRVARSVYLFIATIINIIIIIIISSSSSSNVFVSFTTLPSS